jgi:hypothetical protein
MTLYLEVKSEIFKHLINCNPIKKKLCSQGLELSLRIAREKRLKEIIKAGALIRIQAAMRMYLVRRSYKARLASRRERKDTYPQRRDKDHSSMD